MKLSFIKMEKTVGETGLGIKIRSLFWEMLNWKESLEIVIGKSGERNWI